MLIAVPTPPIEQPKPIWVMAEARIRMTTFSQSQRRRRHFFNYLFISSIGMVI
jgi:hypothetical protein